MVGWNNSQINIKGFSVLPFKEQANTINAALLKPLEEYKLPAPLEQVPLESDSPEILRVSEQPMQRTLDVLNPRKACEPDRTSSWLLKGYCDLVAFPIMEILTASYTEQRLPTFWKMADVTTLPKRNQWSTSKRNWDQYPWPPVFLKWHKSLTWMVSWNLQSWTSLMTTSTEPFQIPQLQWLYLVCCTAGPWVWMEMETVWTSLLDYHKAFDLIDHSILIRKLQNRCTLLASIINWIIDFFIGQIPAD